jgi:predicted Zn-dependent peptidase
MLNRTVQPSLKEIEKIDFVAPEKHAINAHVNLYHMKSVPNETARLDLYFDAGKCKGTNGIPLFVSGLLLSGTDAKSSTEIHDIINGLGGFFETGLSVENSVVSIYCLRENLDAIFTTLMDAIQNLSFHEQEVAEFLADKKQQFNISQEKVSFLAQREFQKKLFASNESYGSVTELEDFDNVSINDLKSFHKRHYLNGLSKVVIVGDIEQNLVEKISEACKPMAIQSTAKHVDLLRNDSGEFIHEKEGAMQTAIRVGRTLFNKKHADFLDFLILHTILGDYFGSRLMSNIREDKGYTYGIGTALSELSETGHFLTATEVRKDVRDATLNEIKFEFNRLRTELVPNDELELVKSYMLGQLLKSADGPYAMTDLFLGAELQGMGLEFYNDALKAIHEITPERIQALAVKYLKWEDMTIVAFG